MGPKSENTEVQIIRSCFTDNVANTGGVIWTSLNTITVNLTTFTNNTSNFGGVLWAQQATVNSRNLTLGDNLALVLHVALQSRAQFYLHTS